MWESSICDVIVNTLEKAMATHSSTLAWKIPWMEEPGRLQSMGSRRVRHDWATSLSLFNFHFYALEKEMATHSRFLPGESQGQGSLVGCRPWGSQSRTRLKWLSSSRLVKNCGTWSEPSMMFSLWMSGIYKENNFLRKGEACENTWN